MNWTRKHFIFGGLAILAFANLVVLAGVAYNRSGEPEATLKLTERELGPSWTRNKKENSGLELQLRWRVVGNDNWRGYGGYGFAPDWLDAAKMRELGFDPTPADLEMHSGFGRRLSRDVLVALELDGPAYQQSIKTAETVAERMRFGTASEKKEAEEIVPRERNANSRLFAVDAGLDAAALRSKYPDRSKYVIVRARVRPMWDVSGRTSHGKGFIDAIMAESINVPLELRGPFEGAEADYEYSRRSLNARTRFEATIAFGKRFEPWMTGAAKK